MPMNSLPRWLISITHMPEPCQSSISSPARARTSSGSTAGPALKLKMRAMSVQCRAVPGGRFDRLGRRSWLLAAAVASIATVAFLVVALQDPLHAGELLALAERDQGHALGGAPHLADLRHRGADQHPAG